MWKCVFEHVQNVRTHIILHMRKVSSGPLLDSLIHSIVSNDSACRHRRLFFDFTSALSYMNHRCPHMPENTFLHRVALMSDNKLLGPVLQSIVSLTSSLAATMLTVLVSTISNSRVFLLKIMWIAFANAKATHIFFQKYISTYTIF